jgi:AraC family transcriptional regulator
MEPRIVDRGAFKVMGVSGYFASAGESFHALWDEFMSFHDQIRPLSTDGAYYGVYLGTDHSEPLDYLAGMAVEDVHGGPEGLLVREIPAARYAMFECTFEAIGDTYGHIWNEWLPSSPYQQDDRPGFDLYPPDFVGADSSVFLYVPIKVKGAQ